MALSGVFSKNIGTHWKLTVEWSATQSIANNTSTIKANFYWVGLSQYSTISSSATKDGSISIAGDSKSFTATPALSGSQKKLLASHSHTVTHNSDGSKSLTLSASFTLGVTLGGTYYGKQDLSSTITLNTIPRTSKLTSSPSWTAGSNLPITISRASSAFTHTVKVFVGSGKLITDATNVGNSTVITFTKAENTEIFKAMEQGSTLNTTIILNTYNGSTLVGSNSYTGTVTAPKASTASVANSRFTVGGAFAVSIQRSKADFYHTITLKDNLTFIKEYTNVGNSLTFDTSDVAEALYGLMPDTEEELMSLWTTTYYNGVQVGQPSLLKISAMITGANPIFTANCSYRDINPNSVSITGNDQYIIQNLSAVQVEIPSTELAQGQAGASIVEYIATLAGNEITASHTGSAVAFNFGEISSSGDLTLLVKAVDSRGNSAELSKTVKVIGYEKPTLNASATRLNGFEENTTIALNGTYSPLTIDGQNKNSIQSVKYRYRKTSEGAVPTWETWTSFVYSVSGNTYTATREVLQFLVTDSYYVEFMVTDRLNNSVTVLRTVNNGKPILFIDTDKKSVGVGKFPESPNSFEVDGVAKFNSAVTFDSTVTFEDSINTSGSVNASSLSISGSIYVDGEIVNEAYITPSLQNGWTNFSTSGGYQGASYWKDKNGMVHLTGLIKGGTTTNATVLFTLPVGYRPSAQQIFLCHGSTKYVRVDVQANGNVIGNANLDATWTSLAGISFRAER